MTATDEGEGGIGVLHVDDEPGFLDLTARFLEVDEGSFTVTTETSARDGLARLEDGDVPVDCVVSDYDMPGMDGLAFLERVREEYPDLPFILFTGKGSEEIASEAISKGVTDYLQKEGGIEQFTVLANRIENAVSKHRAETALRRSEERYRRLVGAAPVPIITYTADGELTYANDAAVEFLGAESEGEVLGTRIDEYVHPDMEEAISERFARLVDDQEPVDPLEQKIVALDGEVRHAIVASAPVTDGGDAAVQTIAYDITERKEREQALRELNSIATEIKSFDTVEAVCERTVAAAENVLNFDLCVVNVERDGLLEVTALSSDAPPDGATPMSVDEGLAGKTYRTGESYLVDDLQELEVANPQGPYRGTISVPIGDHGVFQTVAEEPGFFDEDDLELAELLVAHCAAGLDRIRHRRELHGRSRDTPT